MSDALPTVSINSDNGPVLINKSDFDPAIHTLAGATPAPATQPGSEGAANPPPPPVETAPLPQLMVGKVGKKVVVIGEDGKPVEGVEGIAAEYADEGAAWTAIAAVIAARGEQPAA